MQNKALNRKGGGAEEVEQNSEREVGEMDNVITKTSSSSADSDITPPPPTSHLPPKKEPGGWRSVKYILGNESFEKLASMGLIANLTVYLQTRFNMDGIQLVNVFNIWSGSTNVTPLLGAFLSDTYLGRFRTLIFGSTASFLGMVVMSVTAGIPNLRPLGCTGGSNCQKPEYWQLGVLYLGLGLLAIGAGGLALVIALTVVVYVQTNVSWVIGYSIPAVCLLFSIVIFLIGKHTYIITKPQGTVFVDLAKVIVAACKKRAMSLESTPEHSFYDPPLIESDQRVKTLDHTNMFKFFDKAALIADPKRIG
ncbi:hypothetical protein OIU78_019484 [Salix suchowensis]|nr:hypothetical protein OIU78_019484 [Salix suchowensis]